MSLTLGDGLAWLESQPDWSLDGIFTDPPWGKGPDIEGQEQWLTLLRRLLLAARRVVKPSGSVLVWYGLYQAHDVTRVISESGLYLNAILTVQHLGSIMIPPGLVFCLGRERAYPRNVSFVLRGEAVDDTEHPAARPANVVARILREWFKPGDKIADPFAGSNTTGWAAGRIGIDCYSFEIDPVMYATAIDRGKQVDLFRSEDSDSRVQEAVETIPKGGE